MTILAPGGKIVLLFYLAPGGKNVLLFQLASGGKNPINMRPLQGRFSNNLTPEGSHVYSPLCPWRHKFPTYYHYAPGGTNSQSYYHYAPGGTNSQHITIMPLAERNSPNIIYFVSARVNILFQTIPLDGLPSKKDIQINKGFPTTCVSGTNPQKRLSSELCLLSPIIQ